MTQKTPMNVAEGDMPWLNLEIINRIVGHTLLHADLAPARGSRAWKKRRVEVHSAEDGSGEIIVVHGGGLRGGMVVALGVESHRKSGSWYLHSGKGCEGHWKGCTVINTSGS